MTLQAGFFVVDLLSSAQPAFSRDRIPGAVFDADGREILIPLPKTVELFDDYLSLDGVSVSAPRSGAEPAIDEARLLIAGAIDILRPGSRGESGGNPGPVIHLLTFDDQPEDSALPRLAPPSDSADAYSIRFVRDGNSRAVLCAGATPRAAYYAATTLVQLISRDGDGLRIRNVSIDDWPSYEIRFLPHDSWGNRGNLSSMEGSPDTYIQFMDWIALSKTNTFGCGKMLRWKSFFSENNIDREWVGRLAHHAVGKDIVDFLLYLHVGGWGETPIDLSTDEELETLIRAYGYALDSGAKHIGILADDYRGFTEADRKRFKTYEDKHIYMVNRVYEAVRAQSAEALVLYCAYGYQTVQEELRTETAKIARAVPDDVSIIWTGPETRSRQITTEDMEEITDILGRKPFLWDNTIYATYDWRRPTKFLNAFTSEFPPDMPDRLHKGIHVNGSFATREVDKVHLLTMADYLWNHRDYDPETSLRRAIARVFGSWDAVEPVLAWRDNYLEYNYWVRHDRLEEFQEGYERDRKLLRIVEKVSANADAVAEFEGRFAPLSGKTLATYNPQQMALHFETNSMWKRRDYDLGVDRRILEMSFPLNTPSREGHHVAVTWTTTPPGFRGKLIFAFLLFSELWPPKWTEHRFLEVLCNDEVLYREDLAVNSRMPRWLRVDVTTLARKTEQLRLGIRVIDEKPVSSCETRVILGRFHLIEDNEVSTE